MLRKALAAATLMALTVSAGTSTVQADDTFRLDLRAGGPLDLRGTAKPAAVPGLDDLDDTVLVHRFWRPYYGGFYRSFYWGGFYRPYYYRPYFVYYPRFYAPTFSFYYSRPFFSYGFSFGYYQPWVSGYYSPYVYCPISDVGPVMPYTATQPGSTVLRPYANGAPPQLPYADAPAPGSTTPSNPAPQPTYPYDGGPSNPVPMPGTQPATPQSAPPPVSVPLEGRPVSLPGHLPKHTYPAYGEGRTSFAQDRAIPVKNPPIQRAAR
jgi:hypothetical protein